MEIEFVIIDKHGIHSANVKRIKRWTPKRKSQYKTPDESEVDTYNETFNNYLMNKWNGNQLNKNHYQLYHPI